MLKYIKSLSYKYINGLHDLVENVDNVSPHNRVIIIEGHRGGANWLLWGAIPPPPPPNFQIFVRVGKKLTWASPNYFNHSFSSSPIQLKIKEKPWPTSIPTSQPQIPNKTKIFSFKLKTLPAQPSPIPNQKCLIKQKKGILKFNPPR